MLKVGQIERTEITGYSSEGMGVCRIEGCAVFVPNAIRGEVCDVKVTHVSRNSAHGKIEEIHVRSPHRIPRACPDAKLCGGCQLHHMDYAEELSFKAQKVTDALNRIGGQDVSDLKITGAAGISAYRNKAQYPISEKNGKPIAGFYKNRTHEVVPVKRCAILPEVFDRVKDVVIRWAGEDRVSVYDEGTGQGLLRHIYVRRGAVSGQVMVCVVANGDRLPRENRLVHALRREIPGLASVVLSVNRKNTNVVLGDESRTLWGQNWIEDALCGFSFRLSPRSFYQVNHDQAQRLYEKAVELADLHGTETVLDLYCGTGTITLALSRRAGKAVGVEVVPQAIEDAKENAARNGVTNTEFFCADAGEAAKRFASQATGNGQQATGDGECEATGNGQQATGDGECEATGNGQQATGDGECEATGNGQQATGDGECEATGNGQQATGDGECEATGNRQQATGDGECEATGNRQQATGDGECEATGSRQQATGDGETDCRGQCAHWPRNDTFEDVDVIVVDPPRKGLAPEVVDAMVRMAPRRIVYVSCDPATLARDVKLLTEEGYALTHAEAFDLFPRTFHVETVVQLVRKNPDMTVCVTVNLEDADLTAAESKATYEQIKDYVLKTYGFQVTSLQIAQTKRKLGLPTGDHYNLSQKENQHIPQCPPEKEASIRETLRHFRMI